MKKKTWTILIVTLTSAAVVLAAIAVGFGIAYFDELKQQDIWDAEFEEAIHDARAIGSYFEMTKIDASQEGYEGSFTVYIPGPNTQTIIDSFNEYILENNINLSEYDLTYPLTTGHLISWPERIYDLISNGISEVETAKGKSPEEIEALINNMFGEK